MSKLKKHKFSDLYEISSGISSKPEQAGHGAPFLSFSSVFNNYFLPEDLPDLMDISEKEQEKYSIKEGDIFLTRTSETLDELGMSSVAIKDYPCATYSGFLKRLRPIKEGATYPKFMAFYLRNYLFRKTMNNNAIMTLRASFNEQIFSYLDLLLPDYSDQKAIGDLLFLFNQKIDLNNKINQQLEAMAKLIYDYWFVQFDFPDENGKPYKSSGGKMVYNAELKREIPEGWEVKELKSIALVSKETVNPSQEPDKKFRHYSIPTWDKTGTYGLEAGREINSNKFAVSKDNILVSKLNPWFSRVVLPSPEESTICSTEFVVWKGESIEIQNFLFQIATHAHFIAFCTQKATGTSNSHKRVNPKVMMSYQVPFQKDFAEKFGITIGPMVKQRARLKLEKKKLIELRDWLLPMLMNGQVRVKDNQSVPKV